MIFPLAIGIALACRPWRWSPDEWNQIGNWNPSPRVVWSAAVLIGLTIFWFVLTRFRSGDINAIDFTVYYDRPVLQTLLGKPLFVESADDPTRAYRSYLAVHAHWIMLPLSALYWVSATPLWLLALSVIAVIAGAMCTLKIVQKAGGGGLLGSAAGLAFVLNDNTARTLNYGFHTEVLYAAFIPWMIYSGMQRNWKSFAAGAVGCIAVKEDAFLLVFAVAVVLVLTAKPKLKGIEWLYVTMPIVLSTINLILYYRILVPRLSATGVPFYANYWSNYGRTALTAVVGMLLHPGQVFVRTVTSAFMTKVIAPHLYLPIVGWRWFIGITPVVFLYGSSSNAQLRAFGIYYAIVLVPFLVLGSVAGAARCARLLTTHEGRANALAAAALICGALVAGISNAGYSLRPWRPEISAGPQVIGALRNERHILVQSSLYPHVGYSPRVQLLTRETLHDPRYSGAVLLLAPALDSYPLTAADIEALTDLPVATVTPPGLIAVRGPG